MLDFVLPFPSFFLPLPILSICLLTDAYFRICNTSATCRRRCICLLIKAFRGGELGIGIHGCQSFAYATVEVCILGHMPSCQFPFVLRGQSVGLAIFKILFIDLLLLHGTLRCHSPAAGHVRHRNIQCGRRRGWSPMHHP